MMMEPITFVMTCDRCGRKVVVKDGTPTEVAIRYSQQGWTSPGPFTDRCPECST